MASVWDRRYGPHDDHYPTNEEVQKAADRIIAAVKSQEEATQMSWSVGAVGKGPAIRTEIAQQFNCCSKCVEPEESIRQSAASTIDKALESISGPFVVKVTASGSQGYKSYSNPEKGIYNTLNIAVEVLHGFVE